MLIFLFAQAAIPMPPPTRMAGKDVASLISLDDYPAEALANGWQGTVVVDLLINSEGRARGCRIVHSSTHPVLDLKTCELLLKRAKFSPARDSSGHPVEDVLRTPSIIWRIWDDQQQIAPRPSGN